MKRTKTLATICMATAFLALAEAAEATDAVIGFDSKSAPLVFAVDELDAALRARQYTVIRRGSRSPQEAPFRGGVLILFRQANAPERRGISGHEGGGLFDISDA